MTNREMINQLDNGKLAEWIFNDARFIGGQYTNSILGLKLWLDSEYKGWLTKYEYARYFQERYGNAYVLCDNAGGDGD